MTVRCLRAGRRRASGTRLALAPAGPRLPGAAAPAGHGTGAQTPCAPPTALRDLGEHETGTGTGPKATTPLGSSGEGWFGRR